MSGIWRRGWARCRLPVALKEKYPNAERDWLWQWFWPGRTISVDPRDGQRKRHHLNDTSVQRVMQEAVRLAQPNQTGHLPHAAAFVRHASVGKWLRHPHGSGFARAQGCGDDADLHACDAEAGDWGEKPAGCNSKLEVASLGTPPLQRLFLTRSVGAIKTLHPPQYGPDRAGFFAHAPADPAPPPTAPACASEVGTVWKGFQPPSFEGMSSRFAVD